MSAQALATVIGPPLMLHSANTAANPAAGTPEVDHAQPIAVLKYLLQIWPQPQISAASGNVIYSIIILKYYYYHSESILSRVHRLIWSNVLPL